MRWLVLLMAIAVAGCGNDLTVNPLPPIGNIVRIDAMWDDGTTTMTFQVPATHWQSVYDALQPARRDNHPAKWVMPGTLSIVQKNGGTVEVALFETEESPGAFSVHASANNSASVYYRGGHSAKLHHAIIAAYRQSQQAGSDK